MHIKIVSSDLDRSALLNIVHIRIKAEQFARDALAIAYKFRKIRTTRNSSPESNFINKCLLRCKHLVNIAN